MDVATLLVMPGFGLAGDSTNSFATGPRLGMWVWASDLKTQANADAMIAYANGRMTDLWVFAIDDSVSPKTWLGAGTKGTPNATVIGGKTPMQYVIAEARKKGIRVHAWMWLGTFAYWGGATGVLTPECPNNATYNDAGVWNFHDATARALMVEAIADFMTSNPGLSGINFNLEDTTANIVVQDITDFFTEIKAAVSADLELSFCGTCGIDRDVTYKLDTAGWFNAGIMDTIVEMGYNDDLQKIKDYVNNLPAFGARNLFASFSPDTNTGVASDFRLRWKQLIADGYTNFSFFCWGDDLIHDASLRAVIDEYLGAGLGDTTQAAITKIVVTPGTSWAITVGGTEYTTAVADVGDHLYYAPLKRHIEAAAGIELPAFIFYRVNSATAIRVLVGGYEP